MNKKDIMTDPILKKGHQHKTKDKQPPRLCPDCNGQGFVRYYECTSCNGEGVILNGLKHNYKKETDMYFDKD